MKFLVLSVLCVSVVSSGGCTSSVGGPPADTPTGGLEFRMFVRDGSGAESLYQVNRDGSIEFGGGMKARLDDTAWKGQLTPDEIHQLRELVESHGWYQRNPASTDQPPKMIQRVTLNSPQVRRRFRVKGESPDVAPIRELLDHAALRRLEPDLERLPQPSAQRQPPGAGATTEPATQPK